MIARTKMIKTTKYFLSSKESEKIYDYLGKTQTSVSDFAKSKGVGKSSVQQILNGTLPLTKDMYKKAFSDFDFIELPPKYND